MTRRLIEEFARRPGLRPDADRRLDVLTDRERDMLGWSRGAVEPGDRRPALISQATVKTHITRLLTKLQARDRAQLVVIAYESGLVRRAAPEAIRRSRGLKSPTAGSRGPVNKTRQAPESAEIRAQEEVRTQDEEARADRGAGDEPIQEAVEQAAEVAEETGGLGGRAGR